MTESEQFDALVRRCRATCLWFVAPDVAPRDREAQFQFLAWFFPLQAHEELGLTLHPFDLATNKVLAMAGRLEVRDWVDVLSCDERLQPLGFLVWAACGKDPGFGPALLVREIRRASRYSQAEVDLLEFDGPRRAEETIDALPAGILRPATPRGAGPEEPFFRDGLATDRAGSVPFPAQPSTRASQAPTSAISCGLTPCGIG